MTSRGSSGPVSIYALCDPDRSIRYIGRTCLPLADRLKAHIDEVVRSGRTGSARGRWIAELLAVGQAPDIQLVATTEEEQADQLEREQIAAHLARGCRLTNAIHTPGWAIAQSARTIAALEQRRASQEPGGAGRLQLSGKFVVRIGPSLHHDVVQQARAEGLSLNQFVAICLARAVGQPSEDDQGR